MRFEWDADKSKRNRDKHGLDFEEAKELFLSGVDYLEIYDHAHSICEDRFIAIGPITNGLILVVWTEREEGRNRLISARWATTREAMMYQRFLEGT